MCGRINCSKPRPWDQIPMFPFLGRMLVLKEAAVWSPSSPLSDQEAFAGTEVGCCVMYSWEGVSRSFWNSQRGDRNGLRVCSIRCGSPKYPRGRNFTRVAISN
ncbi:hypothetical protein DL98DRAFT_259873 [Cadophora sp. DSE1049]|nr:hypothetical protein DL98DRAFT_259873 [Cadophora sp. DSE1049]